MFNQKLKQGVTIALGTLVIAVLAGCSRGTAPAAQPPTQAQTHGSTGSGHDASAPMQAGGGTQTGTTSTGSQGAAQAAGQRFRILGDQSEAAYHVGETFLQRQQFNTAVGRTQAIEGELLLDLEKGLVLPSSVRVDLSTLKSDQDRRDRAVQRALGVAEYRYATFHIESASGTPSFRPGQEETFTLRGTMELRGVKKPVAFEVRSRRDGEALNWTASTSLKMTEFGIEPPNVAGIVSVEEDVRIEVKITAQPAG